MYAQSSSSLTYYFSKWTNRIECGIVCLFGAFDPIRLCKQYSIFFFLFVYLFMVIVLGALNSILIKIMESYSESGHYQPLNVFCHFSPPFSFRQHGKLLSIHLFTFSKSGSCIYLTFFTVHLMHMHTNTSHWIRWRSGEWNQKRRRKKMNKWTKLNMQMCNVSSSMNYVRYYSHHAKWHVHSLSLSLWRLFFLVRFSSALFDGYHH